MSKLSWLYHVDMTIDPTTGLHEVWEGGSVYMLTFEELFMLVKYFRSLWPNREKIPTVENWFKQLDESAKNQILKRRRTSLQ